MLFWAGIPSLFVCPIHVIRSSNLCAAHLDAPRAAGCDLLADTPALLQWLRTVARPPLTIGMYVYLDGEVGPRPHGLWCKKKIVVGFGCVWLGVSPRNTTVPNAGWNITSHLKVYKFHNHTHQRSPFAIAIMPMIYLIASSAKWYLMVVFFCTNTAISGHIRSCFCCSQAHVRATMAVDADRRFFRSSFYITGAVLWMICSPKDERIRTDGECTHIIPRIASHP